METAHHSTLKRLAAAFLLREGFQAVGIEVRCPGSRYRVDAAGYLDQLPWPTAKDARGAATLWSTIPPDTGMHRNRRCPPRTIIIECKQSRSDFIRDDGRAEELLALRDQARRWKSLLEEKRIKVSEPHLRESGSALFTQLETWNFAGSRLTSYRKLLRRIRQLEAQLHGETKFCLMSRYRLADQLYLLAPRGLVRAREVPDGWGLIEVSRAQMRDVSALAKPQATMWHDGMNQTHEFQMTFEAPVLNSPVRFRDRLLRNIAVAATREAFRWLHPAPFDSSSTIESDSATTEICRGTTPVRA